MKSHIKGDLMKKITLGRTRLKVTPICFGTWEIGGMPFFQTPNKKLALKAINSALDVGINFIDTAPVYGFGRAEKLIGEAIRSRRTELILATKCGLFWKDNSIESTFINNSANAIKKNIEESLERLGTDYIDLYQVHWPEKIPKTPIKELIETLEDLQIEGKIRYYGISNFSKSNLEEALLYGSVSTSQNQYSIINSSDSADIIKFCHEKGIAFLAYSPLHRGVLTNTFNKNFSISNDPMVRKISQKDNFKSNISKAAKLYEIAQDYDISLSNLVLNYTLTITGVDVTIVGSKNPTHITDLENVFSFSIKPKDVKKIEVIINQTK